MTSGVKCKVCLFYENSYRSQAISAPALEVYAFFAYFWTILELHVI